MKRSLGFGIAILLLLAPLSGEGYGSSQADIILEMDQSGALPASVYQLGRVHRLSWQVPIEYSVAGSRRTTRDLRRWYALSIASGDADETIQELETIPGIASVRKQVVYQTAQIPNDVQFSLQYGLLSNVHALADINAPQAWDETTGSGNTVIAIVDGGVDLEHEDLASKIWRNGGEIADNGIDDDGNGYIDDTHGWDFVESQPAGVAINHATHVAGIAAAASNNNVGVAGVDWGARIMSVRVLSASGTGREESIIRGIGYAVDNGADVINLSIVGTRSEALLAAIERAYASGVVVVAAAGNSGLDTSIIRPYPICAEADGAQMVLGVGGTDEDAEPARFSNYGDCVDVSAPGDDIFSTKAGNRYGEMSGTSMSSPFAAGVAGLYLAKNPGASPGQVISAIIGSRKPFVGDEDAAEWNERYSGHLDAAGALGIPVSESFETDLDASDDGDIVTSPTPTPAPQESHSGGEDSGGGSGDGGGGGGGGGGSDDSHEPEPTPLPRVRPARRVVPNLSLVPRINEAFRRVFQRNPNVTEHRYWYKRVKAGDKQTFQALTGAMRWQAVHGRTYVPSGSDVAGVSTDSLVSKINAVHRTAFGRNPSVSEHGYWMSRVVSGEKSSEISLLGAMVFHRLAGIFH